MARKENGRHNSKARIDSRGRLSIPKSVRNHLKVEKGDTVVISNSLSAETDKTCINIFPLRVWEKVENDLKKMLNFGDEITREIIREVMGEIEYAEIDDLGRILIPGNLMDEAGLKNEVLFVKMPNFVEVWDPDKRMEWKRQLREKINIERYREVLNKINIGGDHEERNTQASNG